jgi:hypothetical protein
VAAAWVIHVASGVHGRYLGVMGEEATAAALQSRRMRRRGWQLVNGLYFEGLGDVDHVAIGPAGIFAIESKWTSTPVQAGAHGLTGFTRDPLGQAKHGAAKIENLLRHGKARLDVQVRPMVVLWGPGTPSIPGGRQEINGVIVCEGRRQRRWKPATQDNGITMEDRNIAAVVLRALRAKQKAPAPDPDITRQSRRG